MRILKSSMVCCVVLVAIAAHGQPQSIASLRRTLGAAFEHDDFRRATWGCVVARAVDGTVLYARNPRTPLVPASNQKLYVAAACLAALGPGYRSRTEYLARGPLRDGVLHGDLLVRGYGSFDLTARYPKDEPVKLKAARLDSALDSLADRLRERGVREVRGRVVPESRPWTDMVRNEHYPSAAALLFNDNTINIQVARSVLTQCPSTRYMFKIIPARSGEAQVRTQRLADTIRVNVKRNSTDYWRLNGGDPLAYYAGQLQRGLQQRGMVITGQYGGAAATPRPLLVTQGFPLRDVLKGVLTWSDNLRAEMLFLSLAYELEGTANYANGARACRSALRAAGLSLPDFRAADGSGLSRENRASAADTVDLLRWLRREHHGVMRDTLAIAGRTGTLQNRLKGPNVKGQVLAKTGSLRGVRSLSGYVTSAGNSPLCFSFICNGTPSDERAWVAIERACDALRRYRGP